MATGLYVGVNSGAGIVWNQKAIYSDVTQLSVVDSIGAMGDSLSIPMVFPTSYITVDNDELPLSGQTVRLVIDDVKLFEGVIPAVSNEWGPNHISINNPITVSSYASLLNSKLVVGEYEEGRAGARIKSILTDFTDTFANDLSQIDTGVFIPKTTYDWQSIATVISQIASSTGYMWHVDFDKKIHFYADLDKTAPITAINADTNMSVGNLVVQSDASGIVNVVILKDFASKNSNKYSHVTGADGNTSFFSLPMPPFSLEDTDVYVSNDSGETWVQKNLVADPLDGSQESIEGAPGLAYLCFTGDTLISTPDGLTRIEDGPRRVYDHLGNVQNVVGFSKRVYCGDVIELKKYYGARELKGTPEHPIYILDKEHVKTLGGESVKNKWIQKSIHVDVRFAKWKKMEDITLGDWVSEPIPEMTEKFKIDPDLAWFIGLYLADGFLEKMNKGVIRIAINHNEIDIINRIWKILKKYKASNMKIYECANSDNGGYFYAKSKHIYEYVSKFNTGSYDKSVPEFVYHFSKDAIIQFLKGYWQGDGCVTGTQYKMNSVNISMLNSVRKLFMMLGVLPNFYEETYDSNFKENHTRYTLDIQGKYAEKLEQLFDLPHIAKFRMHSQSTAIEGGRAWYKVKSIARKKFYGYVYNMEVDNTNTYIAETLSVHNCKFNWGVRFGTSDIPGAGTDGANTQVKTNYNPEDPERVTVVFDEDSIQEFSRREGTNGRHEMTVSASDFSVENDGPVLALGNLILSRRAWPVVSGSFVVRTQSYGEWAAGETFTIISTKRDIFDVKTWVSSGYVTKNPVRVWVTSVKRRFDVTNDGIIEVDTVEFSSVPWS